MAEAAFNLGLKELARAAGQGGGGQLPPPGGRHYLSVPQEAKHVTHHQEVPGLLRHLGHQEGLLKLLLPDGNGQGGGQPAGQPLLAPLLPHSQPECGGGDSGDSGDTGEAAALAAARPTWAKKSMFFLLSQMRLEHFYEFQESVLDHSKRIVFPL